MRAVLPLGPESRAAAQFYANATARDLVDRDLSKSLFDHSTFDVVFGLWTDLDRSVLDDIYRRMSSGDQIGLVCATDTEGLLRRAASRAADLSRPRNTPAKMVDVLATTSFAYIKGARAILGGAASDEDFLREISTPARLMRVVTGSDGLDANLGSGRVTCAIPQLHLAREGQLPRCVLSGTCQRLDIDIDDVAADPRYFSPDTFRADILVWQSCQGLLSRAPTVDDAWGLGRALAESISIGALITTVDFILTSANLTEGLLDALRQGQSVGQAVTAYAQAADAATHRLFLFGDPDFRAEAMERPALQISARIPASGAPPAHHRVSFGSADLDLLARAAGPSDEARPAPHTLIGHVANHCWARLTDVWWSKTLDLTPADPPRLCGCCGGPCDTFECTLTEPLAPRLISICRACGPEADLPSGRDITLTMPRLGDFELGGQLPQDNWTAAFILYSDLQSETQVVDWPADADGRPKRRFSPIVTFPPGSLRAGFCLIDVSFGLITVPFRAHEHATFPRARASSTCVRF